MSKNVIFLFFIGFCHVANGGEDVPLSMLAGALVWRVADVTTSSPPGESTAKKILAVADWDQAFMVVLMLNERERLVKEREYTIGSLERLRKVERFSPHYAKRITSRLNAVKEAHRLQANIWWEFNSWQQDRPNTSTSPGGKDYQKVRAPYAERVARATPGIERRLTELENEIKYGLERQETEVAMGINMAKSTCLERDLLTQQIAVIDRDLITIQEELK